MVRPQHSPQEKSGAPSRSLTWIAEFGQERDRYLQAVEHEVVELALAVAARILRREAQMDPLLLTGAVRVALGQLSNSTEVLFRVPSQELDLWTEAIAHVPNLSVRPTVVAGDGMRLGECALETKLGSVDLGIRGQLGEIERGFFDRTHSKGDATADSGSAKATAPRGMAMTVSAGLRVEPGCGAGSHGDGGGRWSSR